MTDAAREVQMVAAMLCDCSQQYGKHANRCPTRTLAARLPEVLARHDRRVHRDTEPFCSSCGVSLRDTNRTILGSATYCLTDCTRTPEPQ